MKNSLTLFLLFFTCGCLAQTTSEETQVEVNDVEVADTGHSVKKATILSAVIPTAGQIYNHIAKPKGKKNAYWKVPLFLGALGYTSYKVIDQQQTVLALRNEYRLREQGEFGDPSLQFLDQTAILQLERQTSARRDQFILLTVLAYGIQVADAAVEAHFVHFDVSDDLSLSWSPQAAPGYVGLGIQLNFR